MNRDDIQAVRFEWLKTDLEELGGEATIFTAEAVDAWSDDALIAEFRRAREGIRGMADRRGRPRRAGPSYART